MKQPGLTLTLTALHLLYWRAWAALEVSMEDRREVLLGSGAEIPCVFSLDQPAADLKIEWFVSLSGGNKQRIHYKTGSEEPQVEATRYTDRISVSYNSSTNGNSVLTISSTQLSDEQEYFCRVSADSASDEKHTQLLVFQPPSPPTIEAEKHVSADSDKMEKIATCVAENAYPAPKVLWHKDGIPLQPSDDDVYVMNSVTVQPSFLQTLQSTLHLKMVKKEDKDAEFYCEISYFTVGGESMMESDHVKITVHYSATEVKMYQVSPERLVKEGDRVELRCQGDGNVSPAITFSRNGNELESQNENLMVLENVNRTNSGEYLCSYTEDWVNYLQSNFTLKVHFMDDVVITPEQPAELDEGQNLSLSCNALCSLPTRTVWYKDNKQLDEGNILTLSSVSSKSSGTYTCKVQAPDLPELSGESSVDVTVRGKPEITDKIEIISLENKNMFNLSCSTTGHPTPNITWSLSDEQTRVDVWNMETDNSIISIITISTTSTVNASCIATNEMGTVLTSISVEPDKFEDSTTVTTGTTSSSTTEPPAETDESPKKKEHVRKESSGFIIAILIILVLLLAIGGSVFYFLYKKGKIPCGRSGKQDLTKESASKDDFVVEMKSGKSEEAVLLQGVNGDKKIPNDQ
ncbi:melanoma cell adhesion molecule b isoform X2 [Astyanax mexicanus]|uniref:melanoma cell adhesion molecule b isoform X2 n=1 Tax=Astyanax mexicanus TaxID=7994 RepID=UPI0020CB0ED0|nr:melanoma cell adhesion molecule b isoform X2 [Astyanax mexicanus]